MLKDILFYHISSHPGDNGNWEASEINSLLAMGVFTDDPAIFDLGINFFLATGVGTGTYIYASGQSQETLRDFGHAQMGLGELVDACEIAHHQDLDLYALLPDHETGLPRLAKSIEYMAAIQNGVFQNASCAQYSHGKANNPGCAAAKCASDTGKSSCTVTGPEGLQVRASRNQSGPWAATDFSPDIQAIYEIPWNHYANRRGFGGLMPNVAKLMNAQEGIRWLERAGGTYRPEEMRANAMYGAGTLTHSNQGGGS